tara:strand:- start:14 stop:241 length:228 start_codon:yes stop_codon:yes gene_type:complete
MKFVVKILIGILVLFLVINSLNMSIDARYTVLPQSFSNLGENMGFGINSFFNGLMGQEQPVNPRPYKQQLSDELQ